jgi:uncharacterized membrane protein YgcG
MRNNRTVRGAICVALSVLMAAAPAVFSDPPTATPADAYSEPAKPPLTQAELDQLLAPIALYPDSLLSQVLMASTYPLEIVQADRWAQQNKSSPETAQMDELEDKPWDPSVKSLVNVPQVLEMMSNKLDWTIKLGDAFLEQQTDVMDTVQSLRSKARAAGNLESNANQKVAVEPATATQPQIIVVQAPNPEIIYVPVYNPTIVYGAWWYPAYPPYYYYPPAYPPGRVIWWGSGFVVGFAWGYAWGGCNWRYRSVNVYVSRNIYVTNTRINYTKYQNNYNRSSINTNDRKGAWRHDPSHRDGVPYRDRSTAQKFGAAEPAQRERAREQYRGRTDTPAQRPADTGSRGGAFNGVDRGGGDARRDSQRGNDSRNGAARPANNGNYQPSGNGGANRPSGSGPRSGAGGGGGSGPRARNN